MAQKLGNLDKWDVLQGTEGRFFPGGERTVALEVTSPGCKLWVVDRTGDQEDPQFLALVEGRDRIEFTVLGDFDLFCTEGECWFYTADGQDIVNREIAPVIFTRIANRKDRNPNLEMMEFKMRQNLERRFAELEIEARRRDLDREATYASQRTIRTPPGLLVDPAKANPDPIGDGSEPGEPGTTETEPDDVETGEDKKAARARRKAERAADD